MIWSLCAVSIYRISSASTLLCSYTFSVLFCAFFLLFLLLFLSVFLLFLLILWILLHWSVCVRRDRLKWPLQNSMVQISDHEVSKSRGASEIWKSADSGDLIDRGIQTDSCRASEPKSARVLASQPLTDEARCSHWSSINIGMKLRSNADSIEMNYIEMNYIENCQCSDHILLPYFALPWLLSGSLLLWRSTHLDFQIQRSQFKSKQYKL